MEGRRESKLSALLRWESGQPAQAPERYHACTSETRIQMHPLDACQLIASALHFFCMFFLVSL